MDNLDTTGAACCANCHPNAPPVTWERVYDACTVTDIAEVVSEDDFADGRSMVDLSFMDFLGLHSFFVWLLGTLSDLAWWPLRCTLPCPVCVFTCVLSRAYFLHSS